MLLRAVPTEASDPRKKCLSPPPPYPELLNLQPLSLEVQPPVHDEEPAAAAINRLYSFATASANPTTTTTAQALAFAAAAASRHPLPPRPLLPFAAATYFLLLHATTTTISTTVTTLPRPPPRLLPLRQHSLLAIVMSNQGSATLSGLAKPHP